MREKFWIFLENRIQFPMLVCCNYSNESKNEGVRYPCPQCEYTTATRAVDLKIHVGIIHKGLRYPCSERDYIATQSNHLKVRI